MKQILTDTAEFNLIQTHISLIEGTLQDSIDVFLIN